MLINNSLIFFETDVHRQRFSNWRLFKDRMELWEKLVWFLMFEFWNVKFACAFAMTGWALSVLSHCRDCEYLQLVTPVLWLRSFIVLILALNCSTERVSSNLSRDTISGRYGVYRCFSANQVYELQYHVWRSYKRSLERTQTLELYLKIE